MIATSVCKFRISFTWMWGEKIDAFQLDTSLSCWGDWVVDYDRPKWLMKDSGNLTPIVVRKALEFVRWMLAKGEGEICIHVQTDPFKIDKQIYTRGRLSALFADEPRFERLPVDCPCLLAILDYLDGGDEADLCGALDMLSDAGKFDPEN
jgi:hypothetical protein